MPPKGKKYQRRRQIVKPQIIKPQTLVGQKQSTETVQMMLFGSLSTLFWHRDLFPDEVYDTIEVPDENQEPDYGKFASGVDHTMSDDPSAGVRLLRRGRSTRIDTFLDVLEEGMFDALRRKWLKDVQISILADPTDTSTVLETWTITIKYSEPGKKPQIEGLHFRSSEEDVSEVDDIHGNLMSFIKQVELQIEKLNLNRLPTERFLTAHLRYTDDCDPNYEPSRFQPVSSMEVAFPSGNGWKKSIASLSSASGTFHNVGLRVSHLQHELCSVKNLRIGKGAEDTVKCHRFENADVSEANQSNDNSKTGSPDLLSSSKAQPEQGGTTQVQPSLLLRSRAQSSSTPAHFPESFPSQRHRQQATVLDLDLSSNAGTENPSELVQACDTDYHEHSAEQVTITIDQICLGASRSTHCSQLSDAPPGSTQLREDVQMRVNLEDLNDPKTSTQFSIPTQLAGHLHTDHVMKDSSHTVDVLPATSHQSLQDESDGLKPNELVEQVVRLNRPRCPCTFEDIGAVMIQCNHCKELQHPQCYGYFGAEDPRLTVEYTCYECLLDDYDTELLGRLQKKCRLRQLMHIMLKENLSDNSDVTERLQGSGLSQTTATSLIEAGINDGYIHVLRHSMRKQSSQERSTLRINAVHQDRKAVEKLLDLFNPLDGIKSYCRSSIIKPANKAETMKLAMTYYSALAPVQNASKKNGASNARAMQPASHDIPRARAIEGQVVSTPVPSKRTRQTMTDTKEEQGRHVNIERVQEEETQLSGSAQDVEPETRNRISGMQMMTMNASQKRTPGRTTPAGGDKGHAKAVTSQAVSTAVPSKRDRLVTTGLDKEQERHVEAERAQHKKARHSDLHPKSLEDVETGVKSKVSGAQMMPMKTSQKPTLRRATRATKQ